MLSISGGQNCQLNMRRAVEGQDALRTVLPQVTAP